MDPGCDAHLGPRKLMGGGRPLTTLYILIPILMLAIAGVAWFPRRR